jgi:hypothetical protein
MNPDRSLFIIACVPAAFTVGCSSVGIEKVRQQFRQAVQEMKADAAILDSDNDGLDAFGAADAKYLRAARADMER